MEPALATSARLQTPQQIQPTQANLRQHVVGLPTEARRIGLGRTAVGLGRTGVGLGRTAVGLGRTGRDWDDGSGPGVASTGGVSAAGRSRPSLVRKYARSEE